MSFVCVVYKRIAPGLTRGLENENATPDLDVTQMKVTDLYAEDELFNFDSSSDEEAELPAVEPTVPASDDDAGDDDEVIETLTKVPFYDSSSNVVCYQQPNNAQLYVC